MGKKNKYIGKIYDGRWKVVESIYSGKHIIAYNLINIYNNAQIRISKNSMINIDSGKYTLSKFMSRKMGRFHYKW